MYYLPWVDQYLIRRPLFSATLCAVLSAGGLWFLATQVRELRAFGNAPQKIRIEQLPAPPSGDFDPGRWVELEGQVKFDCISLVSRHSADLAEMMFGHAKLTYIPATDAAQTRLLIFVAAGDLSCKEVQQGGMRGVIRAASKYDLNQLKITGFQPPRTLQVPVIRFETYGGPGETKKTMALAAFATFLMSIGGIHFFRKYLEKKKKEESGWAEMPHQASEWTIGKR